MHSLLLLTKHFLCARLCTGFQGYRGGQDVALLLRSSQSSEGSSLGKKRLEKIRKTEQEREGRGF